MATAPEAVGAALLGVYTEVLRPEFRAKARVLSGADRIAFQRIVRVFLDRRADERLWEATHFLRDRAGCFPSLVAEEAQTLLAS